jgi:hypothetical protein
MVATVLSPLLELRDTAKGRTTFSVFSDIRLLDRWLTGENLPYSDDVTYIFEQQLNEAGLLVINKMDLLGKENAAVVLEKARERFPGKTMLLQNSLLEDGTGHWLELLASDASITLPGSTPMDYDRYDRGSRQLGWLDEEIRLRVKAGAGREVLRRFISSLEKTIRGEHIPLGHMKFHVSDSTQDIKLSLVTLEGSEWLEDIPPFTEEELHILVNGRIQVSPARINRMMMTALEKAMGNDVFSFERAETAYYRPRIESRVTR